MRVRDIIEAKGQRVISVGPEATVKQALALFVEHRIGSLPVLDGTGKLVGIFSERDVLYGDHHDYERFHHQLIQDVMTPDPITCDPRDAVHEVMGKLSQNHVGQLPVVDEGELIGIVSVGDLIRSLYEQVEAENQHLMAYLYGGR